MEYLFIVNWDKWQTYRKDRGQPPWIKIHRRILRNPEWVSLNDAERGQLVVMWLLAADRDGTIPASPKTIQKLCFMSQQPNINKFIELGFMKKVGCQDDVNMASTGCHSDQPKAKAKAEKSRTEKENVDYPTWLNISLWKEFKNHRTKLKFPMTPFAEKLAISNLKKIIDEDEHTQEEIINNVILKGWKGVYPINGQKRNRRNDGISKSNFLGKNFIPDDHK